MMISTKGRYALRVMIDLAQHGEDGYVSLKTISERQGVSLKYLEAIVSMLNKAGMVESLRGKDGGYQLARKPEEYSIGDILRLVEGSIAPVACVDHPEGGCTQTDHCLTFPLWQKLDRLIDDYLGSVTLRDLIERTV
ncbi:MAG: Rrf2 family transcriptional regulator [Clostridiaceae bacterium]|nr:Rrf2 family transcriptional regulator [Clostridiaceae bacterium]